MHIRTGAATIDSNTQVKTYANGNSKFKVFFYIQMYFYHTPGQIPPHGTGHIVKTVTLGWGALRS